MKAKKERIEEAKKVADKCILVAKECGIVSIPSDAEMKKELVKMLLKNDK